MPEFRRIKAFHQSKRFGFTDQSGWIPCQRWVSRWISRITTGLNPPPNFPSANSTVWRDGRDSGIRAGFAGIQESEKIDFFWQSDACDGMGLWVVRQSGK
jgi:hypothetical protein